MIYNVKVQVEVIRTVTVEASTIDDAERVGLDKAIALAGGIDGFVLSVSSLPTKKGTND